MKTLIIAFLLALPITSFAEKPPLKLISQSEKSETVRLHDGTEQKQKVIIVRVSSDRRDMGPLHLKVEVKSPKGDILTDVMPSFSFADDKDGRDVYLYIKEEDIKKHVGAVFTAEISSKEFTSVGIQYQFKEEHQK